MGTRNTLDSSLIAKVANLAALVEYQSGTVVSRTIIDLNAGTITLFAFDKGQGLSEHTAPYNALVHIIDGEALITIDGQSLNLKNGETTIMPANVPHALQADSRFKMMLVMIRENK